MKAFLLLLLLAAQGEKPLSIDEIERLRMLKELEQSMDDLRVAGERLIEKKFYDCMKAFVHNVFCGCLRDNLPVIVSFQSYVETLTSTKQELNYDRLQGDNRKLVDLSYSAREACVKKFR